MYTDAVTVAYRPMNAYRSGPPARPPMPPTRWAPTPSFEEPTERIVFDDVRAAPPVRRRRRWVSLVAGVIIAVGLVIGAVLGGFWIVGRQDATSADAVVGSCVARSGTQGVAVVGCATPTAEFRVVARLEGQSQPTSTSTVCAVTPEATTSYWKGPKGGVGTVLCLAPLKAG